MFDLVQRRHGATIKATACRQPATGFDPRPLASIGPPRGPVAGGKCTWLLLEGAHAKAMRQKISKSGPARAVRPSGLGKTRGFDGDMQRGGSPPSSAEHSSTCSRTETTPAQPERGGITAHLPCIRACDRRSTADFRSPLQAPIRALWQAYSTRKPKGSMMHAGLS